MAGPALHDGEHLIASRAQTVQPRVFGRDSARYHAAMEGDRDPRGAAARAELTRRDFTARLVALCAAIGTGAKTTGAEPQADATLAQLAQTLFPHRGLGTEDYAGIARAMSAARRDTPGLEAACAALLPALDRASGGRWLLLEAEARVAAVEAVASDPAFEPVRDAALAAVYRHPGVWRLIGYGGSSFEFGGYLQRGFDRVDWLPATDAS
jgi:hypothetical protein